MSHDTPEPSVFARYLLMQIPSAFAVAVALWALVRFGPLTPGIALGLFGLWLAIEVALYPVLKIGYQSGGQQAGVEAMVGRVGVVCDDLDPEGFVQLGSERWRAVTAAAGLAVPAGTAVRVREVRRLTLVVELAEETASGPRPNYS